MSDDQSKENTNRLLTTEEAVQEIFGGRKSVQSLQRAVRQHQIPSISIGRRIYFLETELRAWLKKQMEQSLIPSSGEDNSNNVNGIRRL